MLTSNKPFAEWTEILGSERLTGTDLPTMFTSLRRNSDSFGLKQIKRKKTPPHQPPRSALWSCHIKISSYAQMAPFCCAALVYFDSVLDTLTRASALESPVR